MNYGSFQNISESPITENISLEKVVAEKNINKNKLIMTRVLEFRSFIMSI